MNISKTAKTRVMKLIEFMEQLPPRANKHFDMRSLISHKGRGHSHEIKSGKIKAKDLYSCGTTACALGWACTMPYFHRLGLTASKVFNSWGVDEPELFDLDSIQGEDAWSDLFSDHHKDKTPKEWAKRARGLLAKWQKQTRIETVW